MYKYPNRSWVATDQGQGNRSLIKSPIAPLTSEQVIFEKEFSNWENSFQLWKDSFRGHPDQTVYREYEKKFLDIRDQLLMKREKIYVQDQFEAHLQAAQAMAEDMLIKVDNPMPSSSFDFPRSTRFNAPPSSLASPMQSGRVHDGPEYERSSRFNAPPKFLSSPMRSGRVHDSPEHERSSRFNAPPKFLSSPVPSGRFRVGPEHERSSRFNAPPSFLASYMQSGRVHDGPEHKRLSYNSHQPYGGPQRRPQSGTKPPRKINETGHQASKPASEQKTVQPQQSKQKGQIVPTQMTMESIKKKIDEVKTSDKPRFSGGCGKKYRTLRSKKFEDLTEVERYFMSYCTLTRKRIFELKLRSKGIIEPGTSFEEFMKQRPANRNEESSTTPASGNGESSTTPVTKNTMTSCTVSGNNMAPCTATSSAALANAEMLLTDIFAVRHAETDSCPAGSKSFSDD